MKPRHAQLPGFLQEEHTLGNLKRGKSCWTTVAAMLVDEKGNCWIDLNQLYTENISFGNELLVKRAKNGYIVDTMKARWFRWNRLAIPSWIPVEPVVEIL